MIKKILCQLGTIFAFVGAARYLFLNPILIQLDAILNPNPIVNLISVIGLIALGFWLSKKCGNDKCR